MAQVPYLWIRYLGATSFILLSTAGIILNSILMILLYKGRNFFKLNAFFMISWQLIMCDLVTHTIEFILPIPITLAGFDIYNKNLIHLIPAFMESLSYNGTLFFSFLMTVNRITVFILPRFNTIIFKYYLHITILFVWFLVFLLVGILNLLGCYKTFEVEGFHYQHNCPIWTDGNRFMWKLLFICSTYLPIAMFISYVIMIAYIKIKLDFPFKKGRRERKKVSATLDGGKTVANREFQLLAQGFLICGLIEVENLVFNILPSIKITGQWTFLIDFSGGCVSLLLSCIHPVILFTFNQRIRTGLKNLIQPFKVQVIVK